MLSRIKKVFDMVSWADLIQMSGALAVELAGGPVIRMRYGREDCSPAMYQEKVNHSKICVSVPHPNPLSCIYICEN